ncbi:MAG: transketolase [Deinococcales bacterium]
MLQSMISTQELADLACQQRRQNLELIYRTGMGHIGGDMSATDILITLYFAILNIDPSRPQDPHRDRFIMSKGHCSGALYCTLANRGFFPVTELTTYMQPLSKLNGHPDRNKIPGVETNTGPLGHGLPVAVGAAIGAKISQQSWRTYVLTGDGELQEGSNWEAAMLAGHRGLDNLTVIIDRNRLQQGDWVAATNTLEPLAQKWQAFGWAVREIDGHNYEELLESLKALPLVKDKPTCLIAHTHKGQGISFMQDHPGWHHRVPTEAEYHEALKELGGVA